MSEASAVGLIALVGAATAVMFYRAKRKVSLRIEDEREVQIELKARDFQAQVFLWVTILCYFAYEWSLLLDGRAGLMLVLICGEIAYPRAILYFRHQDEQGMESNTK